MVIVLEGVLAHKALQVLLRNRMGLTRLAYTRQILRS